MELSPTISKFDSEFWRNKLRELGYPLKPSELDVSTLKGQKEADQGHQMDLMF